jgi:cyclophilin family peptidyl-prolyl cis-trans isomerase/HEAT repeat protein
MISSIRVAALPSLFLAIGLRAQQVPARVRTAADRSLLTALIAAEDARDSTILPTDPRRRGLASVNPYIRAFTVRGLGRTESASLVNLIAPALDDPGVEVRMSAADALAQATARGAQATVRPLLIQRLTVERNASVRAALLEAIGRSGGGSAESVKAAAGLIAASLRSSSVIEVRGAIRGLFFLSRKPEARGAGRIPTEITDKLFAMLMDRSAAGYTTADRLDVASILLNSAAINDARLLALFGHADPSVRDRAVSALLHATDTSVVRSILARSVADSSPMVRFRSANVYSRRLRPTDGCAPLVRLARDPDVAVALAGADALSACPSDTAAVHLLDSLASSLKDNDTWHRPTHAFVSLAATNPRRARELMPNFSHAQNFFVRTYADSAARLIGDTTTLYALALDRHPNVQSAAIAGLSALAGHAADSVYIAALKTDDNQLLMAASRALEGSTIPAVPRAATDAWHRLGMEGRQTSKDGLAALQTRFLELGGRFESTPQYSRLPAPTFDDLAAIERTEATIEMADGSIITLRFHPFDAPTNCARFVRLAKTRVFDGLTFHRVAPYFVVQGLSPNANEYSAPDAPFTRDELGRENLRGTVGLSTRGRDTGDGQIFINTVDNTALDHDYTVMATVTRGLEAFDRMQEGARIVRISTSIAR